jgi:hypothetical protein
VARGGGAALFNALRFADGAKTFSDYLGHVKFAHRIAQSEIQRVENEIRRRVGVACAGALIRVRFTTRVEASNLGLHHWDYHSSMIAAVGATPQVAYQTYARPAGAARLEAAPASEYHQAKVGPLRLPFLDMTMKRQYVDLFIWVSKYGGQATSLRR